jgi:hypothetical protein
MKSTPVPEQVSGQVIAAYSADTNGGAANVALSVAHPRSRPGG